MKMAFVRDRVAVRILRCGKPKHLALQLFQSLPRFCADGNRARIVRLSGQIALVDHQDARNTVLCCFDQRLVLRRERRASVQKHKLDIRSAHFVQRTINADLLCSIRGLADARGIDKAYRYAVKG